MSIFQADCPHCGIRGVAFTVLTDLPVGIDSLPLFDTFAACGRCGRAIVANFESRTGDTPKQLLQSGHRSYLNLMSLTPTAPSTGAPDRTPERAANYYRQGMENLPNNLDAAVSMFRSALEAGLREKFPDIEGTLYKRIEDAADQGGLTSDLADWAHHIRLGGNDAVHGEEQFSKEDAERLQTFTELVFMYLFTLPGMLEDAQAEPADGD